LVQPGLNAAFAIAARQAAFPAADGRGLGIAICLDVSAKTLHDVEITKNH
jgi:hypothetical protein